MNAMPDNHAVQTVDDLIDLLSKFNGSTLIRIQDRLVPTVALRITGVQEDVLSEAKGDFNIVLINVQTELE
jgi:hypothetical protein